MVIILVVAGAAYWLTTNHSQNGSSVTAAPQNAITTATATAAPSGTALTSGTSNADLNQDLATIDTQMNALSSDTASMNQSFNDTPVTQTNP